MLIVFLSGLGELEWSHKHGACAALSSMERQPGGMVEFRRLWEQMNLILPWTRSACLLRVGTISRPMQALQQLSEGRCTQNVMDLLG